jgi:hypothetical protein
MTAVAHARPTISPFAIANGVLHIGGHPVGLLAERAGATHRKESRGHTFLVDGGLHHQFAALGNFGQVIRKTNYPVAIANRMGVPGAETVGVAGCLCTRWTCSHLMSASRVPRSATLWRSFRPAPTG